MNFSFLFPVRSIIIVAQLTGGHVSGYVGYGRKPDGRKGKKSMNTDKRQTIWEQLKKFMDESEYILVGIGEEWELKSPDVSLREAYGRLKVLLGDRDYFW